nr:uncharacterized protein LOC101256533 isoform X3 [Solanum lycopersicum]
MLPCYFHLSLYVASPTHFHGISLSYGRKIDRSVLQVFLQFKEKGRLLCNLSGAIRIARCLLTKRRCCCYVAVHILQGIIFLKIPILTPQCSKHHLCIEMVFQNRQHLSSEKFRGFLKKQTCRHLRLNSNSS